MTEAARRFTWRASAATDLRAAESIPGTGTERSMTISHADALGRDEPPRTRSSGTPPQATFARTRGPCKPESKKCLGTQGRLCKENFPNAMSDHRRLTIPKILLFLPSGRAHFSFT